MTWNALATPSLSSPGLTGRSSYSETGVIEKRGHDVLDVPVKPGHDTIVVALPHHHPRDRLADHHCREMGVGAAAAT
jgi:hypothetical protein